jgi:hypothetical protein
MKKYILSFALNVKDFMIVMYPLMIYVFVLCATKKFIISLRLKKMTEEDNIYIEINKKEYDLLQRHRYWLPVFHYQDMKDAKDNEMGRIGNLRFLMNFDKSFADSFFLPRKGN